MKTQPTKNAISSEGPTRARLLGVRRLLALIVGVLGLVLVIIAIRTYLGEPKAAGEAREALRSGRFEEALTWSDRWLEARPDLAEPWLIKAEATLNLEDPQAAFEALRQAESLHAEPEALERLQGILLTVAGRFDEAEPLLARAQQRRSESDPLLDQAMAKVFLQSYRLVAARKALLRWAEARPKDPRPYLGLAEVNSRVDGGGEALASNYRAVLERDPARDEIRLKLAETLHALGRLEEAAQEFERYRQQHPDDPEALAGAGLVARDRHRIEEAERLFERALQQDPENALALVGLAGIESGRGNFSAALPKLERAKAADPSNEEARHRLALALDRLGRSEEAKAEQQALTELRRSLAEMRSIHEALDQASQDPDLQYRAARWLLEHGHAEEALAWARRAADRPGGHPPSSRLLADYFEAQGDHGQANYYRLQADRSETSTTSKSGR